jgi:hypothetical protein
MPYGVEITPEADAAAQAKIDAAQADAAHAIDNFAKQAQAEYLAALAEIGADMAIGAKLGSVWPGPGTAIGTAVGAIYGVYHRYGDKIAQFFGYHPGVPADVMHALHLPVELLDHAAKVSTNPLTLQAVVTGCSSANDALAQWEADNSAIMDDGDHGWFNQWSADLQRIQALAQAKLAKLAPLSAGKLGRGLRVATQAVLPPITPDREHAARSALRAAHDVLAHVAAGNAQTTALVAKLHRTAHLDVSAARATEILTLALHLPADAWAYI